MQVRKTILFAAFATTVGLACAGSASSAEGSDQPDLSGLSDVTLRFGHNAPANSPSGRAAEKLADLVEKKSDGKLTVEVYPANQLGNNRDLVEQTALGGLDMSMAGVGILGYIDPVYSFMQVPFLFKSQEAIHEVLTGDIGNKMAKDLLEGRNIRLLSQIWDRLPRQICSGEPIRTPADLENVLIRSGSKGATRTFKLFGAKPASVPLKEVYLALQNNVVSAVDLPADYFYNLSLYEVCNNLNLVNHTYGTQFVAINGTVYNNLAPAYQQILDEAVAEARKFNNELAKKLEDDYVQKLKKNGMNVVHLSQEQHNAFSQFVHENIDKIEETWPETDGLGAKIFAVQKDL